MKKIPAERDVLIVICRQRYRPMVVARMLRTIDLPTECSGGCSITFPSGTHASRETRVGNVRLFSART